MPNLAEEARSEIHAAFDAAHIEQEIQRQIETLLNAA